MADTDRRGSSRLISFMPMVVVLMGLLVFVAVFVATTTAAKIALVIAILAVGLLFSTAMLKRGRPQR